MIAYAPINGRALLQHRVQVYHDPNLFWYLNDGRQRRTEVVGTQWKVDTSRKGEDYGI